MKIKLINFFCIIIMLGGCAGVASKGVFGSGVKVGLDPRSLGTQIDDTIMDKSLGTKLLLMNKNYFLLGFVFLILFFLSAFLLRNIFLKDFFW